MKLLLLAVLISSLFGAKPELFLLNNYNEDANVTSWYMSEKLDGVRAYWNGENLISRSGKVFSAPAFFTENFPKHELDGELWSKRGDFSNVSSIVNTMLDKGIDPRVKTRESLCEANVSLASEDDGEVKPEDDVRRHSQLDWEPSPNDTHVIPDSHTTVIPDRSRESRWSQLTYNIFEVPNAKGNLLHRLKNVKESKYLKLIKQIKVKDKQHLQAFLKEVEEKGGEGVVVREGTLDYYTGRDNNSLKVKSYIDEECEVVGHNKGQGKYKSMTGSLSCKMSDDNIITIGSGFTDEQREQPPKIGAIITFKYYGLTSKGNPRFPVFLHVRE